MDMYFNIFLGSSIGVMMVYLFACFCRWFCGNVDKKMFEELEKIKSLKPDRTPPPRYANEKVIYVKHL